MKRINFIRMRKSTATALCVASALFFVAWGCAVEDEPEIPAEEQQLSKDAPTDAEQGYQTRGKTNYYDWINLPINGTNNTVVAGKMRWTPDIAAEEEDFKSHVTSAILSDPTNDYYEEFFKGSVNVSALEIDWSTATMKYNCHGFAWHMGGNAFHSDPRWIEDPSPYWDYQGGLYVEVENEPEAEIAFYQAISDDNTNSHSAIRLSNGMYKSKWGDYPIVIHALDNVTSQWIDPTEAWPVRYFKYAENFEITGPSEGIEVGESAVYSLNATPVFNQPDTWNLSSTSSGFEIVSSTNSSVTVKNVSADHGTSVNLTAKVNGWKTTDSISISSVVKYEVSFNLNGGTGTPPPTQTVSHGSRATAPPIPVRTGYDFTGWYNLSSPFNFSTPITNNLALKAMWAQSGGFDFTITNASSHDLIAIYVGLTGQVAGKSYPDTFIGVDPGDLLSGSTKGLPDYGGNDVSVMPGANISNLELELWASTWPYTASAPVRIEARLGNGSVVTATNNFVTNQSLFIPLPNSTVPLTGRGMLHITVYNN